MSEKIQPISPNDVASEKSKLIPDGIIQAVNELIVERWNGTSANFKLKEVVSRYLATVDPHMRKGIERNLYDKKLLDFEDIYRKQGWDVEFDHAAYSESFDDNFTFKKSTRIKNNV